MPVRAISKRSTVNRIKKRKPRKDITPRQSSGKPKYHYGKKRKHR